MCRRQSIPGREEKRAGTEGLRSADECYAKKGGECASQVEYLKNIKNGVSKGLFDQEFLVLKRLCHSFIQSWS